MTKSEDVRVTDMAHVRLEQAINGTVEEANVVLPNGTGFDAMPCRCTSLMYCHVHAVALVPKRLFRYERRMPGRREVAAGSIAAGHVPRKDRG